MSTPIQIHTPLDLSTRILELKAKKLQQEEEIKLQFSEAMHAVRPGNLIKTGINKLTELPLGPGLIGTGLNFGIDLLSKKLLGNTSGPVRTLATKAINYGVGSLLGKKAESIRAYGSVILNRILKGNKHKQD